MLDHAQIVNSIKVGSRSFFQNSTFNLVLTDRSYKMCVYEIEGTSVALNINKSEKQQVKVLKWFEDFWVYVNIRFIEENIFVSMSIFQGKENDLIKCQLFRAEWDDYHNENEQHAQPHWHFTTGYSVEQNFRQYSELFDEGKSYETFEVTKLDIIDVNIMHFAINGNWHNDDNHTHLTNSGNHLTKWFQGIFYHLSVELKYAKDAKN